MNVPLHDHCCKITCVCDCIDFRTIGFFFIEILRTDLFGWFFFVLFSCVVC